MKLLNIFYVSAMLLGLILTPYAYAQTNLALNKTVTSSLEPTYKLMLNPDLQQITDGKYVSEPLPQLWLQQGAVTWRMRGNPLTITIDLEQIKPISGISYSTAAGSGGVAWPAFVLIAVSDDGETWHYQGNLMSLSRLHQKPQSSTNGYSRFKFSTDQLRTKGRYVALGIVQPPYTTTDEIEVYEGNASWLNEDIPGKVIPDFDDVEKLKSFVKPYQLTALAQRRIFNDIDIVRQFIGNSMLSPTQKSTFGGRLDNMLKEALEMPPLQPGFVTKLPINDIHREVITLYGSFLATAGYPTISVKTQPRYAWTNFFQTPSSSATALSTSMLKNQHRSETVLITNASDRSQKINITVQNPPAGADAGWINLYSAVWMDTFQGTPVADALLPIKNNQLTISAGFTAKLWITLDSSKIPPGSYQSTLKLGMITIPININVDNIEMNHPRMTLGAWDYSEGVGNRAINLNNRDAALELMRSHYLNSPWATRRVLPWPTEADFDANHELIKPLNFTALDNWLALWPDAKRYYVFLNVGQDTAFTGAVRGSEAFEKRVGNWAKKLSQYMTSKGKLPDHLVLLIHDEPGKIGAWQDDVIADWAQAINSKAPELSLISDPSWKRPDLRPNQSAFTEMDILMPPASAYRGGEQVLRDYYENLRAQGKELMLYDCIGPVRMFSPQRYYRSQAWEVFEMGGTGMIYWAFGDAAGLASNFYDYEIPTSYAPVFFEGNNVYNSIHWDSVREGVQDFEELSMLQDAIQSSRHQALKTAAQKVLSDAFKEIRSTRVSNYWMQETNPEVFDRHVEKVRAMLRKFAD